MPLPTRFRRAARVFVLDAHDCVTLVQYADDDGARYWATPGGAIELGETALDAAARELREEPGLHGVALNPAGHGHARYVHAGVCIDQDESYFVAASSVPPLARPPDSAPRASSPFARFRSRRSTPAHCRSTRATSRSVYKPFSMRPPTERRRDYACDHEHDCAGGAMLESILASCFRTVHVMSQRELWRFARDWRAQFQPPPDDPFEIPHVQWLRQSEAERAYGDATSEALFAVCGVEPSVGYACRARIAMPGYTALWSLFVASPGMGELRFAAADQGWTLWFRDHVVDWGPGCFFARSESVIVADDGDR